jgi:hypothetical protein
VTDARNARQSTRVAFTNPTPAVLGSVRDARQSARAGFTGAAADTAVSRVARYQLRVLGPSAVPVLAYNARQSVRVAFPSPEHQGTGFVAREDVRTAFGRTPDIFPNTRVARDDVRIGFTGAAPDTRVIRVARYQLRVLASGALAAPATVWVWDGRTWIACPVHVWNGLAFVAARSVRVWDGATFVPIL